MFSAVFWLCDNMVVCFNDPGGWIDFKAIYSALSGAEKSFSGAINVTVCPIFASSLICD